jgi:hypothetical protein
VTGDALASIYVDIFRVAFPLQDMFEAVDHIKSEENLDELPP